LEHWKQQSFPVLLPLQQKLKPLLQPPLPQQQRQLQTTQLTGQSLLAQIRSSLVADRALLS